MIRAPVRTLLLVVAIGVSTVLQNTNDSLFTIANDKLTLGMRREGGAMVRLVLNDDPDAVNPMHTRLGHFVCVDGFGPVSAEERSAGLPGHGEAHRVGWQLLASEKRNGITTATFSASLPLVHEVFRRTIQMVDGENVVYIESALENQLAFDRPINWGEHGTIGPPFLEPGKTVVEMSATRAMTRPYGSQSDTPPHRLADAKEFTWPMAPVRNGSLVDVRPTPGESPIGDHTTSLMDPARRLVFVTAFHPDRRLLLGYVFRREEYPWTQLWESYPADGRIARGLEFATQPFDLPRREVIQTNALFGAPTYRWLPAKSTISSAFLMFYTRTPDRFRRVDDVVLDGGALTIHDRTAGVGVILKSTRGL